MNSAPQDSLNQLPHKMREAAGDFRANWAQWRRDVRDNPSILFRSLPVRLGFWLLVAVGFYFGVTRAISALTPDSSAGREQATRTATIYVACVQPECGRSRQANPPMDFKDWPMKCDSCGSASVYRASMCPKCRNWISHAPGQAADCIHCRRAADAKKPAAKPTRKESADPDDREDGWGG